MTAQSKICLGAIVGVHGIRGEVKVKSFTEIDRNLDKYGILTDKNGNKLITFGQKMPEGCKVERINDKIIM